MADQEQQLREERATQARDLIDNMMTRYGDERVQAGFRGQEHHREDMVRARAAAVEFERQRDNPPQPQQPVNNNQQLVLQPGHLNQILQGVAAAAGGAGAVGGAAGAAAAAGGAGAGAPAAAAAVAAVGTRVRIQTYESGDGAEWRTWRNHITWAIHEANLFPGPEGNHDRAKRNIKLYIYGKAARLTADIEFETAAEADANDRDEETYVEFLDRLQARFLPMAAQLSSQHAVELCKQKNDETVGDFHARLITEFNLAYPNEADPHTSPYLIRRYNYGLKDASVQLHVMQNQPAHYDECLRLAEERVACLGAVASCHRPGGGRINAMEGGAPEGVGAIDQRTMTSTALANKSLRRGDWPGAPVPNPGGKKCYKCGSDYHLRSSCPTDALSDRTGRRPFDNRQTAEEVQAIRKGKANKKQRGGRAGASSGGRGGSTTGTRGTDKRRVNVIEADEAAMGGNTDGGSQFIASMNHSSPTGGFDDCMQSGRKQ